MIVIEPSYEVVQWPAQNVLQGIERIGRVCYKSEDRITEGSAEKFCLRLVASKHESVLEHASKTVRFIVDRGVSHELVRHRLASFSQESTRYCNYGKGELTFIRPCFWDHNTLELSRWHEAMYHAENSYLNMIASGAKPEEARSVLPNSLKTDIIVTANVREWRHIFSLRVARTAHPQIRQVMCPLLAEVSERIPVLFENLGVQ